MVRGGGVLDNPSRLEDSITKSLFGTFLFLVFAFPALRMEVGGAPIYAIDVTALALIGWGHIVGNGRLHVPEGRLFTLMVALLLVSFSALLQGLSLSGYSIYFIYTMGRYILNVWAIFAMMSLLRNRPLLKTALHAFAVGVIAVSLIGILEELPQTNQLTIAFLDSFYYPDFWVNHRLRFGSSALATWFGSNKYAGVLSMGLAFLTIIGLKRDSRIYLLAVALSLIAFFLAQSRHAFLALFPVMGYVLWRETSRRQRAAIGLGGIGLILIVQISGAGPTPMSYLGHFGDFLRPISEQKSITTRINSLIAFIKFASAHPFRLMVGFGPDVGSVVGRGVGSAILTNAVQSKPIVSVLGLILEFGVIGTILYFWILIYAISSGVGYLLSKNFNNVSEMSFEQTVVYAGTVAIVVGLLLHPGDQYFAKGAFDIRYILWGIMAFQQVAIRIDR